LYSVKYLKEVELYQTFKKIFVRKYEFEKPKIYAFPDQSSIKSKARLLQVSDKNNLSSQVSESELMENQSLFNLLEKYLLNDSYVEFPPSYILGQFQFLSWECRKLKYRLLSN